MITTLIPAYKPAFIEELLLALVSQTFKNFRVIISDDSPNAEITQLLHSGKFDNYIKRLDVKVIEGPRNGGYTNCFHLVRNFSKLSDFFHLYFDDDIIYPTFYESHLNAHSRKDSLVSVSARWNANEHGQPINFTMDNATNFAFLNDFSAQNVARSLIPIGVNKLGEYSNAIYRKEAAERIIYPNISGISYFGVDDLGSFINTTIERAGIWIPIPLSAFRMHANQNTHNTKNTSIKCSHFAWIALSIISLNHGWVNEEQAWGCMCKIKNKLNLRLASDIHGLEVLRIMNEYTYLNSNMIDNFLSFWNAYLIEVKLKEISDGDLTIKLL